MMSSYKEDQCEELGELEWNPSQKIETAYSRHRQSVKGHQRTYSSRGGGSMARSLVRSSTVPIMRNVEEESDSAEAGIFAKRLAAEDSSEEFSWQESRSSFQEVSLPPRQKQLRRFQRSHSVTGDRSSGSSFGDNELGFHAIPRVKRHSRSHSMSHASTRSSTTSVSTIDSSEGENTHPNNRGLPEFASPKRVANDEYLLRGSKKSKPSRRLDMIRDEAPLGHLPFPPILADSGDSSSVVSSVGSSGHNNSSIFANAEKLVMPTLPTVFSPPMPAVATVDLSSDDKRGRSNLHDIDSEDDDDDDVLNMSVEDEWGHSNNESLVFDDDSIKATPASVRVDIGEGKESVEVDDIVNDMPSTECLRYLLHQMRVENKQTGTVNWNVIPYKSWDQQLRTSFMQWGMSLGFYTRTGGNGLMYLQIAKRKAAGLLGTLEKAWSMHEQHGSNHVERKPRAVLVNPSPINVNPAQKSAAKPPLCSGFSGRRRTNDHSKEDFETDGLILGFGNMNMADKQPSGGEQHIVEPPSPAILLHDDVDLRVECTRPSVENHSTATDLMAHLHGHTPMRRRSGGRPPRSSMDSTAMSVVSISGGPSFSPFVGQGTELPANKLICFTPQGMETPSFPQNEAWGSRPVSGRDWGDSETCLAHDLDFMFCLYKESLGNDTNDWESSLFDPLVRDHIEGATDLGFDLAAECEDFFPSKGNLSGSMLAAPKDHVVASTNDEGYVESIVGMEGSSVNRARTKRRQGSMAKLRRLTLAASATSRFSMSQKGFSRRKTTFATIHETLESRASFGDAIVKSSIVEEASCARNEVLLDFEMLRSIFSFLSEGDLVRDAGLVCSFWADAVAYARADIVRGSVQNSFEDIHVSGNRPGYVVSRKQFSHITTSFPWGRFLGEGGFKRVYKVHNVCHGIVEAISVMDLDLVPDTAVVGTELEISMHLSSLATRAVCPNFVVMRETFSCDKRPAWGTEDEKTPLGDHFSPNGKPRTIKSEGTGRFQFMRMELCDGGDVEEFLKSCPERSLDSHDARLLLFQLSFALHAAADKYSLKHYDLKLLNVFLKKPTWDSPGSYVMRYGLGQHVFALSMNRENALVAKLADFGTSSIDSGTNGQPVTIAQFTTLENTPPEFMLEGDKARQGHGHDNFNLGLCMLHLFTGHAPYEEILEEVLCPAKLQRKLKCVWESKTSDSYSVIRDVIQSDVELGDGGTVINGESDDTFYHTLYRFFVLFGVPDRPTKNGGQVWKLARDCLLKGGKHSEKKAFDRDRRKYSIQEGNNPFITRARERLLSLDGGMDLLMRLVHFDPQERATPLDVLNSPFMAPLRESSGTSYSADDTVKTFGVFSTLSLSSKRI